jgi:hypothetical protein
MSRIPDYATPGSFEMARACGYASTKAYLVGAIAVHRSGKEWKLSHAATGLGIPGFGKTLEGACRIARSVDAAIDWSTVRRGKEIGIARGFTKNKRDAVGAMLLSFRHIAIREAKA